MTEEAAATAGNTEGEKSEGKPEERSEGKQEDGQLGPEGEKALAAFKTRARTAEKELKDATERLEKLETASKSETEKALDKARKEAKSEAQSEFEKERRSDRLAVAVAGHARELADVDDVILNLERQISSGDVEVFDSEGKVQREALDTALEALLKQKPHLKASGVGKPQGEADGGKGEGGGATSLNDDIRQKLAGRT